MSRSAAETLQAFVAAQVLGVDDALRVIDEHAVFDLGRGRFEGHAQIRGFLERLEAIHSQSRILHIREVSRAEATAVFEQRDDDLRPLGIQSIRLDVRVETGEDGRIRAFAARPTPESIEALAAARSAGLGSEGTRLAERAGTLPSGKPG